MISKKKRQATIEAAARILLLKWQITEPTRADVRRALEATDEQTQIYAGRFWRKLIGSSYDKLISDVLDQHSFELRYKINVLDVEAAEAAKTLVSNNLDLVTKSEAESKTLRIKVKNYERDQPHIWIEGKCCDCGADISRWQYPGQSPKRCSQCKATAERRLAAERKRAQREREKAAKIQAKKQNQA